MTLVLLLLPLGCQPLYLPPVPTPLEARERFELEGFAEVKGGRPSLDLAIRTVPSEGWLAIQWFSPANREVASESRWIEPADAGQRFRVTLPEDVELLPGRWRAVLSRGDEVVRQLSVDVPDPGSAGTSD
ncbi:MAG: hypothetical protein WD314_05835 [Trueperaceae bacterium]